MGHLMSRDWLRSRLRLNRSASYRLIGGTRTALINSDAVLTLLNRSRRGPQPVLTDIPSDIMTSEEIVAAIPDLAAAGITSGNIVTWTRRKKNPPPFFLLTQQLRRFSLAQFSSWLKAASTPGSR